MNRLLDFSPEKLRESVEKSPPKAPSSNLKKGKLASAPSKRKGKGKRVFDLTSGDNIDDSENDTLHETSMERGTMPVDQSIMLDGDDQTIMDSGLDQGLPEEVLTGDEPQSFPEEDSQLMGPPATAGAKEPKRRRGRVPASTAVDPDASQMSALEPEQKRRGRPPGPKKTQAYQDPDTGLATPASPERRGRRNPPPSLRDPNIGSKVSKASKGKPHSRAPSVASTSRFIQRSETPANDSGTLITRYGRQSIKPLATWRGEKTIMGDRTIDSLPGIKEVVRVDEVIEPRPRQHRSYHKGSYRARSRLANVEEEQEEEDERAPWEIDPGIMVAQVMDWDPNTNKYDEGSTRDEGIPVFDCPIQSFRY